MQKYPTQVEDTSTIVAAFPNGAHGIIDNYFNVPDAAAQNALELFGTKGSIIARGTIGQDPTGKMFSILQAQEPATAPTRCGTSNGHAAGIPIRRHRHLRADDHAVHRVHSQNSEPPAALGERPALGAGGGCHLPCRPGTQSR